MRRVVLVGVLLLLALPASAVTGTGDTGQEIWVEFYCATNQAGDTLPMFSVEGRPGAEFTVNNQAVGAVLNGGYGVEGENTWTATPLPGFELTSPNTGVVALDCGTGFETAGGGHPDCERYPQKCEQTTTTQAEVTTTITAETTSTSLDGSTTTAPPTTTTTLETTTTLTPVSTTVTNLPVVTLGPTTPTTPSADPTVAPADAQLPDTGLSHDVWAGLTFAAFVLLTMGGMAVLAGRDDE